MKHDLIVLLLTLAILSGFVLLMLAIGKFAQAVLFLYS